MVEKNEGNLSYACKKTILETSKNRKKWAFEREIKRLSRDPSRTNSASLKMKRILIHSHPQFAYIARCVFHATLTQPVPQRKFFVLHGVNYLKAIEDDFAAYMHRTGIMGCIAGEYKQLDAKEYFHTTGEPSDKIAGGEVKEIILDHGLKCRYLFEDAIEDSLYRGLGGIVSSHEYYKLRADRMHSALKDKEMSNFFRLYTTYTHILGSVMPDVVYLSHGNYTPYIAMVFALLKANVPFVVIHGGHQAIYTPNAGWDMSSLSPLNAIRDVLHNLFPGPFESRRRLQELQVRDANSFIQIVSSMKKQRSLHAPSESNWIQIILPIFTEVNHHYSSSDSIFDNRYEWLMKTVEMTAYREIPLIIKRHPHESAQEKEVVNRILKELEKKFPAYYAEKIIMAVNGDDLSRIYLDKGIKEEKIHYFVYQSMSTCELPQAGRMAHSGNPCFGHKSFVYTYESLEEYSCTIREIAEGKFKERIVDNKDANLASIYIKVCNRLGHGNEAGGFRKAFDQFYHFGKVRNDSTDDLTRLVAHTYKNLSFKLLEGKQFNAYMEKTNDLEESKRQINELEL